MTINTALARCTQAVGNAVDESTVLLWLFEIESTVIREIAETHENSPHESFPLSAGGESDKELFVPDPYSELYVHFAVMKNDLRLRDTQRYLNSAAIFRAAYSDFADFYNRKHNPVGEKKIIF